jgi:V/A-type H+/Na+-transporting ATPase subunit F
LETDVDFYCIADEDTVRGFRLAGVDGQVVTSPKKAAEALERAVGRKGLGVLILTDAVAAGIRNEVDAVRTGRTLPLVVEIPGPEGPMPGRKALRQFIQEAVGIRIGHEEGA